MEHKGRQSWSISDSSQSRHTSSWKFWRKLSSRRPDKKSRWSAATATKNTGSGSGGGAKVTDHGVKPRDLDLRPPSGGEAGVMDTAPATSGSLPDVLDKAVLTRTISLKAPPKPPRLFLCRSSSLNQYQTRSAELAPAAAAAVAVSQRSADLETGFKARAREEEEEEEEEEEAKEEPIYVNAAFGAALKSGLSGNDRIIPPTIHNTPQRQAANSCYGDRSRTGLGEGKEEGEEGVGALTLMPRERRERSAMSGQLQPQLRESGERPGDRRQRPGQARESAERDRRWLTKLSPDYGRSCNDTLPRPPRASSTSSLSLSHVYYSLPHRPKSRHRLLSSQLMTHPHPHPHPHPSRAKSRSRSVEQTGQHRHQTILHSVLDLLCQRFDPFPLLDSMHAAGVLTAMDLQAFRGHPDRKLICENVLNAVGNADYSVFLAFLDVLRSAGSQKEISAVMDAMKDIDCLVHDLPSPSEEEGEEDEEEEREEEEQILAEEKILSFEVGYLAADGVSLKPVVELERARPGERRTLPRMPHGSLPLADPGSQPNSNHSSNSSSSTNGNGEGLNSFLTAPVTGPVMVNVCVTGHSLSGSRALALAQVLRTHSCLLELRIGKTQLCSADVAALCGALRHNTTLASLDLRLNGLTYLGASAVASVLAHTQVLQQLNLSSTGLEVAGCREVLCGVVLNRTVTELDLSFLNVGDAVCDSVRDVLRANSTLRRLRLRSNNLSCVGVAVLAEGLSRNRSLLELDLSRNSLGDAGIDALARYIPDSSLTEVSLENCNVTSAACGTLSQMIISGKRLRSLDLSVNPLGDEGIQGLAAALERSSVLHSLALNMCGVTNDGFSALLDVLEKNTSIWLLKLCYNHLGREHLNPAATSDNLRYRLRIVTSSKPKLRILLWGNSFSDCEAEDRRCSRRYSSLR